MSETAWLDEMTDNSDIPVNLEKPMFDNQHANATLRLQPAKIEGGKGIEVVWTLEEGIVDDQGNQHHPGKTYSERFITDPPSSWKDREDAIDRAYEGLGRIAKAAKTLVGVGATRGAVVKAIAAADGKRLRLSFKKNAGKKKDDNGETRYFQNVYYADVR